jgi:hypothetical protein
MASNGLGRIAVKKAIFGMFAVALSSIFSAPLVHASGGYRVIVMGDDSDPATVRRTNDIYKRVIAEIRRPMRQKDYDILDEDILAVQLGFTYQPGMSKKEIISAVLLANKSKNVNTMSRFLVLMRIHVVSESMSFTKQIHTRIDGEIYDVSTGLFIDSYEIPKASFPVPLDCNDLCLIEQAGSHAREISSDLGATLTKQLSLFLSKSSGQGSALSFSGTGDTLAASTSYTFTLKNFRVGEISEIVKSLREISPGTVKLDLIESGASQRRYQFITRAPSDSIIDNITFLLGKLQLSEDDVKVGLSNQTISVEKLK